jgi:phage protein D
MAMDSDKKAKEQRLKEMRERADALGVKYHHRANADTIEAAINARLVELDGERHPREYAMEQRLNDVTVAKPPEYEEPLTEA